MRLSCILASGACTLFTPPARRFSDGGAFYFSLYAMGLEPLELYYTAWNTLLEVIGTYSQIYHKQAPKKKTPLIPYFPTAAPGVHVIG